MVRTYMPVEVDHRKGEHNHLAKLTERDVRAIRYLCDEHKGLTLREIAKQFGVSVMTVWKISQRRSWAHVTEEVA